MDLVSGTLWVKAKQVYTAWNHTVRLIWSCPLWTRTYFVQQLLCCGHTSAKVDILLRYVKFFHSLRFSASHEVQVLCRYLARDVQSVTGKNLQLVGEISHLDPWHKSFLNIITRSHIYVIFTLIVATCKIRE
jgi:hypothetical protein